MDDPVDTDPAIHHRLVGERGLARRKRLHRHIVRIREFLDLKQIGFEGRGDRGVDVAVERNGRIAENGLGVEREIEARSRRRASVLGRSVQLGDDVAVDATVQNATAGHLHRRALIALRFKDVEAGLLDQIVPLREGRGLLVVVVVTSRDQAVDATRHSRSRTGIDHEEGGLVALDDNLGGAGVAKQRLMTLETCDIFRTILNLGRSSRHDGLHEIELGFHRAVGRAYGSGQKGRS